MTAPRVYLGELSAEQRAAIKGAPVVSVEAIKGHGGRHGREPSKVEIDYGKRLEMQRMAGELRSVEVQPEAIDLPADRCRYTADFKVVEASGAVTYYETKGARKGAKGTVPHFHDEAARIKTKLAARVLSQQTPPARLLLVWPAANGGWSEKVVKP